MPRPLYPRERYPVAIVQKTAWAPGPVWSDGENFAPPPKGIPGPLHSCPPLGLYTNPNGVRSQTKEYSLAFLPHVWDRTGMKLDVYTGQPQCFSQFSRIPAGNAAAEPQNSSFFLLHNDQFVVRNHPTIRSCTESCLADGTAS